MPDEIEYWTVPREWENHTAVIFGSGPSLNPQQIGHVLFAKHSGFGQISTIVINRTITSVPCADVHYFCDHKFYNWLTMPEMFPDYADVREAYRNFQGRKITISQHKTDALHLRRGFQRGLSEDPQALCTGMCSGYQAINLAFLFGAKRIILLGFDQRHINGRTHHHAEHPRKTGPEVYDTMLECWPFLAEAIAGKADVINCTPGSRIECFHKMDLQEAI